MKNVSFEEYCKKVLKKNLDIDISLMVQEYEEKYK